MTDELGSFHLDGLPMGTYNIQETKTLEGYVLDELVHVITLAPESDTNALIEKTLYVDNDFTKVEVDKVDMETKASIQGAILALYNADTNELVKDWVSTGKPMHFDKLPIGNYVLKEKTPAAGYVTAEDLHFTVAATTELQKFVMEDDFIKVEINKIDTETKEALSNAELELFRYDEDNEKVLVEEWTSTADVKRLNRLPIGRYLLHEKNAPTGYERANDIEFEVKETGEVQTITMEDQRIYSYIKIKKVDAEDHEKVLAGAEFTMYSDEECTKELAKVTTGADGIALFDHLKYQTVYIKETKAPEGYHLSTDMAIININDDWVDEDNEKTIIWADHIIEIVNTGRNGKAYLGALFFTSLGVLVYLSKKKKKMMNEGE